MNGVDPGKKDIVREIRVPDSYVSDSFSLRYLPLVVPYIAALVLVLVLVIGGASWGVSVAGRAMTNLKAVQPSPTAIPAKPQAACPSLPASQADGKPSLSFCSPEYLGNVAGPASAQIVLVGKNFPSSPNKWFLVLKDGPIKLDTPLKPDTLAQCPSGALKACLALPDPSFKKPLGSKTFLFGWRWQKPFPINDQKQDYLLIARIGDHFIVSAESFTLLTSQAPCISIVKDDKPDKDAPKPNCKSEPKVSFQQGDTIKIRGANWLLGWQANGTYPANLPIEITARCLSGSHCTQDELFDTTIPTSKTILNQDGTFLLPQSLSLTNKGNFVVTARTKAILASDLAGEQRTVVAEDTLVFGTETNDLVIQVT